MEYVKIYQVCHEFQFSPKSQLLPKNNVYEKNAKYFLQIINKKVKSTHPLSTHINTFQHSSFLLIFRMMTISRTANVFNLIKPSAYETSNIFRSYTHVFSISRSRLFTPPWGIYTHIAYIKSSSRKKKKKSESIITLCGCCKMLVYTETRLSLFFFVASSTTTTRVRW